MIKTFNYRIILFTAALLLTFGMNGPVMAEGVPWSDHQAPFDFLFGNHIDTHQQTMPQEDGSLFGFLYIKFTGEFTPDGVPIARHADATDPMNEISVGWQIRAIPGVATAVYHQTGEHPIWLVDDRKDIPQPGGYSHFHWLDEPEKAGGLLIGELYDGYFLELTAKDRFAFRHGPDLVYVTNGLDLATHTNIVFGFPEFTDGKNTGGQGGGYDKK